MSGFLEEVWKEKRRTEELLRRAEKELMKYKDVEIMGIRAKENHHKLQFYKRDENSNYQYLHSSEKEKAIDSIRSEYYRKIQDNAKEELKLLTKLEKHLERKALDNAYQNLGKAKQKVVTPIVMPKEQFIEAWLSEEYTGKPFPENSPEYYTDRGERVRSKSEKIIADKLYREGIHYRYEYPLELTGWGVVYPDFTILDVENRRNIIYEHFGMMDDENYAGNAIAKVQRYASAGYYIGDNFFITMESSRNPLDSRTLDGIVQQLKS